MNDPLELTDVYESTILLTWDPQDVNNALDVSGIARTRQQSCVVLTAWNPGHLRPNHEENTDANLEMLDQLRTLGYEVWACDGASPDGSFVEPGFCVWAMSDFHAQMLGRAFGQYAVFVFDQEGRRSLRWL